jgi:hypothetical protein
MFSTLPGPALDAAMARFNRICRLLALAWLAIILPLSLVLRPTYQDLSSLYIGGLVAKQGTWNALYPIPSGEVRYFIGEKGQSAPNPLFVTIAAERGVKELSPYINPPWQAVVLMPLGWLSFRQAQWAVLAINILCMWGVSVAAGRGYELCAGRRSWTAGFITLLVACSLLAYRSIRVQNVSPAVAFCIALTVWDMMGRIDRSGFFGGLAMAWGAILKVATVALLPLALAMRRWRLMGWAAGLLVLASLITWQMAGAVTFREFFGSVAPTLGRSTTILGNKSLQGFLLRITGQAPLGPALSTGFHALQLACLALVLWLLLRRRPQGWRAYWSIPAHVFAAAVALVAWLLIFGPFCLEHYLTYLCPFWGWLIWEGTRSRLRLIAVATAILLNWVPLPALQWLNVPEPLNSYMLAGLIIMFVIALLRLHAGAERSAARLISPKSAPDSAPS